MPPVAINNTGVPTRSGRRFLIVFGLFWSSITLAFDGFLAWSAYNQLGALNYAKAIGTVTSSKVETDFGGGDDGPTSRPEIKYTFAVAGKVYRGDRYRYGQMSSNDNTAARIVAEFPVGRKVDVYYSPDNPSEAVLAAGLQGSDLFLAMFMLPFNLIMLGVWIGLSGRACRRWFRIPAGGVKFWDDGFHTRIRLEVASPLWGGAIASGLVAFCGVFAIAFTSGFNPPVSVMRTAWIVLGSSAMVGWLLARLWLARGRSDMRLDDLSRTLILPRTLFRKADVTIPLNRLTAIEIETVERKSEDSASSTAAPTVVFTDADGTQRRERLVEWYDDRRAEEFAAWLRERLGMAAK